MEKIKLLPHQERAISHTASMKRVAYYHDMGLGKTFTGSEKLISLGAPEIVVTEEGRLLAEEMVLYYFGKDEPIVWD